MNIRQLLNLVVLAAIWGASFLFMVIAAPEFGAIALIELRVGLAALVLLPIWWWHEGRQEWLNIKQHAASITLVGIFNSAAPFILFAYSVLHVTGGVAAVLNSTAPIYGAFIAWFWLKQRLNLAAAIGLVIGVVGVAILVSGEIYIASNDDRVDTSATVLAILSAALAPFLYGIAANLTSAKLQAVSPLSITTFSLVAASIVLLPMALLFLPEQMPSLLSWLCAITLAILCTSLASLMFFRLITQVGSTRAMTVAFLIPLFGTLWGALFINESITFTMIAGMVVILLGTALVTGLIKPAKSFIKS